MKIRTITTGIMLRSLKDKENIFQAAEFNQKAKSVFEKEGYDVQTTRITTNSWEDWLKGLSENEIIDEIRKIEQVCKKSNVSFFNIGYAYTPEKISLIPRINRNTSIIFCSAMIGSFETGVKFENVKASANVIKQISEMTPNGYGNFRFCASANCKSGIPFFPAGYNDEKQASFAIGLECSDLAVKAFSGSKNLEDAGKNLSKIFSAEMKKVEKVAEKISKSYKIKYRGIDVSLAPSLAKSESIAFAYEKLGIGSFGNPGTLAISAMITNVLKALPVKKCGYSGLMLPVCEDFGLAERANEGAYNITNLLLYSAVCGCGLDTVPIPGNASVKKIEAILLDMATLAIRLNKPLSARLFPVPGRVAGEMTCFNSPYLVKCRIFELS